MAILTLFTAIVAIYNNDRVEYNDDIIRRMNVAPELLLKIEFNDDIYEMEISNDALYSAKIIYLYDTPLLPYIKSKSSVKVKFTINEHKEKDIVYVSDDNFDIQDNMMNSIELIFQDIDGRIILQKFDRDENNYYIPKEQSEYLE